MELNGLKIKFAHVSDCHLGAWRRESLNELGYQAFEQMISTCLEENVDFVLMCGDLYDNSNPKVDVVDLSIKQLRRLRDNDIPVYGIMGSHDFSPSNRTMIRPLISAGFYTNVCQPEWDENEQKYPLRLRWIQDDKTGIKLAGMRARKNVLEKADYEMLNLPAMEGESGNKIFLLHTLLAELKENDYEEVEGLPRSFLPNNCLYYAGGHAHKTIPDKLRFGETIKLNPSTDLKERVIYPGCLFPTNFWELEKIQHGGFCIVEADLEKRTLEVKFHPLKIKDVLPIFIDASNLSAQKVLELIKKEAKQKNIEDKIIPLRIAGTLSAGKPLEIDSMEITEFFLEKGAFEILINKIHLSSKEYEQISIGPQMTIEQIEGRLIHEHAQKSNFKEITKEKVEKIIHQLLKELGDPMKEEETKKDYVQNAINMFYNILGIQKEDMEESKI